MPDAATPLTSKLLSPHTAIVLFMRAGVALRLTRPALDLVLDKIGMARENAKMRDYSPTASDVIVATFAKSGTNWAMQIGLQIAHRGAAEFRHVHDLVAWPEIPHPEVVALDDPGPRLAAPTGMRVIKTHLPAISVPYDPAATYVTIIRDPKEVLVSAYYFLLGMLGILDRVSPQRWFEIVLANDRFCSAWAEHTAGFWAWRDKPNVYVRTFSELEADHRGAVEAIAARMRVELSPEELELVVERSSFPYMKARDGAFAPPRSVLVSEDVHPSMMRRGVSGGSDELLGPELGAAIDEQCRRRLLRLGSDFPYDELFGPNPDPGADASASVS